MTTDPEPLGRSLPAAGSALSMMIVYIATLPLPLAIATQVGLSERETASWMLALYGFSGLLTLVLVLRYRQPLLLTGNLFMMIFIASLGGRLGWSELVGASMAAGLIVLVAGHYGSTRRLSIWLPTPIVFAVLAGAVLPFVLDIFLGIGGGDVRGEPVSQVGRLAVGGALLAYVLGRRLLEPRLPPILPALVVGFAVVGFGAETPMFLRGASLPVPELITPRVSLEALATATPVMVVLITLQANVPSMVFLRAQSYRPPSSTISTVSGAGTVLGSFLGPMGVSLSLPATALAAGTDAGPTEFRHRAAAIAGGGAVLVGLLADVATDMRTAVPNALLFGLAGLALIGVFSTALQEMTSGPLRLGPALAFVIVLLDSDVSLLGLGPFFWALVVGVFISRFLEAAAWREWSRTRHAVADVQSAGQP